MRGLESKLDVGFGVGGGEEGSFKLRGSEEDAAVEQAAEIGGVAGGIGRFGVGIVSYGSFGEEESGKRSNGVDLSRYFLLTEDFTKAGDKCRREFFDPFVQPGLVELIEGSDSSAHGEGVAGKSSGLIDGAERGDAIHDFCSSTVGRNGQTAANDLSKGGEVSFDAVERLTGAVAKAEAGDDLVHDEQSAMFAADFA